MGENAAVFIRSSIAYKQDGSMVTVDNPRFETGAFGQGIMMEEGCTNLLTADEASIESVLPSNYQPNGDSASVTRSTDTAMHGSASMKVSASIWQGVKMIYNVTAGQTYSYSIYAKGAAGGESIYLSVRKTDWTEIIATSYYPLSTSSFTRIPVTFTVPTGVTQIMILCNTPIDAIKTWYIDCLQLEQKGYVTSWIEGGASRSDETMTIPTAGIFAKGNWTVEGTYIPKIPTNVGSVDKSLFWIYIDASNYYKSVVGWGGEWYLRIRSGGVDKIVSGGSTSQGTTYHWMIAGNGSVIRLCVNGAQIGSDLAYTEPVGALPANAYIGSNSGGLYQANGILDNVRISSRARSLSEHQAWWNGGSPAAFTVDADTTAKYSFDYTTESDGPIHIFAYDSGVGSESTVNINSPPFVTINSVSKYKISGETGYTQCVLKFQCDEAIQAWEVRQDGSGVGQGILLESGGAVAANTEITAYIDWNEIIGGDGTKEVNIYAQDAGGDWTPYHQGAE